MEVKQEVEKPILSMIIDELTDKIEAIENNCQYISDRLKYLTGDLGFTDNLCKEKHTVKADGQIEKFFEIIEKLSKVLEKERMNVRVMDKLI